MVGISKFVEVASAAVTFAAAEPFLRNSPFLMTHDAATGYIGQHDIIHRPFFETQGVGLLSQITCGARALDIRVLLDHDGSIRYHHGKGVAWVSDQTLDSTLPALAQWANEHPSELILLMLSHCFTRKLIDLEWEGISCTDSRIVDGFAKTGIRFAQDCNSVNSWTLEDAKKNATMDKGGKMMVVPGEGYCMQANYDQTVKSREAVAPYITRTMAASRNSAQMFSVQSFVQQSFEVPLKDSAVLNPQVLQWVRDGKTYQGVNLLEVNLICDKGTSISRALGASVTDSDQKTCMSDCADWCQKYGCEPVAAFSSSDILI